MTMTASTTQACMPSTVSCNSANVMRTCSADGSSFTDMRCADGTVCQGAGQCMPVKCDASKLLSHNGNGQVTVYWFAQGTLASPPQAGQDVNCSFDATRASNDDNGQNDKVAYIQDPALFGAMNLSEYNGAATCGACVEMTQGGRSVTLTIADSCNPAINNNGSCTAGHIDMSRNAFQQLTGQSTGNISGISWKIVPCDKVGKVQFLLKKPDDMYWNQFLVLNHRYPIVKAEVLMKDGRWVSATREDYNYWLPPEGAGPGGDMGTYRVRVTDVNGAIVEEQLALQGGLQGGNGQFDCQP
jgi:expansin (peptidoglycan-binding protein)